MPPTDSRPWNRPLAHRPSLFFLILTVALAWLSYFRLSDEMRMWVLGMGVLLPLGIAGWMGFESRKTRDVAFPDEGSLPAIRHPLVWLALLLILSRLYRIGTIPGWISSDEGFFPYFSLELLERWKWVTLWGDARFEGGYIYLMAGWFKLFGVSFGSFRAMLAVISIGTAFLFYWAVRGMAGPRFAFSATLLFGFNFWILHYSRLGVNYPFALLWEILVLGMLIHRWRRDKKPSHAVPLWLLALAVGAGFYVVNNYWIVCAGWIVLAVAMEPPGPGERTAESLGRKGTFVLFVAVSALPIVWARLEPGGSSYLQALFKPGRAFENTFEYLVSFFTGIITSAPYGPRWGGTANPLLGSFAILGILVLFRSMSVRWMSGFVVLGVATFLPGMLSSLEMYRITPVLPLVFLATGAGMAAVLVDLPRQSRGAAMAFLVLVSAGLDAYHYLGIFVPATIDRPAENLCSIEYERIHRRLVRESKILGPVLLMGNFHMKYPDQTLAIAAYPYNALRNPRLKRESARRVALVAHQEFGRFLKKRFPDLDWTWLNPGTNPYHSTLALGFLPISSVPAGVLEDWARAQRMFERYDFRFNHRVTGETWTRVARDLEKERSGLGKDPLVLSAFWEKVGSLYAFGGDFKDSIRAYSLAISEGYPIPHLIDLKARSEWFRKIVERRSRQRISGDPR